MNLKRTPMTVLGAIVALVFIAAALVVGIDFAPRGVNDNVTPLVTTVLGFVGIAIPGLLAAYKAESNNADLRNGVLVNKVKQALGEYANDPATPPVVVHDTPVSITTTLPVVPPVDTTKAGDVNNG